MPYVKQDNTQPDKKILEKYTHFRLAHQYDPVIKVWRFKGYTCSKCGRTVQNPNIVPKHNQNCKAGKPQIYCQDPDPEQIVNVRGEPWTPFETNQKKPDINTI
jgi:hypothetical protein